jgi:hypothetical protein
VRVIACLALVLSCGGDDPVNPCPTGDCSLPQSTIVKFQFDSYPEWKFTGDTCIDLGVAFVRVEVVHVADPSVVDAKDVQCGEGQATFVGLPEGPYAVAVTPLDAGGVPVVHTVGSGQVDAPGMATVNVPYTAWIGPFTGTLLFRLAWAGLSCDAAVPPVTTQTLTLLVGGLPVTQLTDSGQKLDGTDPKPCRALTEQFSQFIALLPFGPATFVVVGKDATDTKRFEHRFDTFVGAGQNNTTITIDVPPPDAAPLAPM